MSEARQRVLDTAERLFQERGYSSVSMRDIADALGMRQASLYYHAPKGKEELFVEVTQRGFERHRTGLACYIADAQPTVQLRLQAVIDWIFTQPPLHLMKLIEGDMVELTEENRHRLMESAHAALFAPIEEVLRSAVAEGQIRPVDPAHMTGLFITMLEGVAFAVRQQTTHLRDLEVAYEMLDILLHGLIPRQE